MCSSDTHEGEGAAALDYGINSGRVNFQPATTNHDYMANGGSFDGLRRQADFADYRKNRITDGNLVDGATNTVAFAENIYLHTWCIFPPSGVNSITEFHSGVIWDPSVTSFPPYDETQSVNGGAGYAYPVSRHPGGFNMAMWDGSAKHVSNTIDYTVYARLMSSDGRRTTDPSAAGFTGPTPAWQANSVSNADY
jgi:prepilin-type processing-associated H-X9-DG protein